MDQVKDDIAKIGKAMLALGFQNTHSGNISVRRGDDIFISKTGSMLGHLDSSDIVKPGLHEPESGLFQASSETGTHRRILQYSNSVIHGHTLPTILLSYSANEIQPLDFLGQKYLGRVPVEKFEFPIGSKEMDEKVPEILKTYPAMVVKTHGPFVRGSSVQEAFNLLCLLDYSAGIILNLKRLGINPDSINIPKYPNHTPYQTPTGKKATQDPRLIMQFVRTSSDLFTMGLSPFQTGSISVEDGKDMYFSPRASTPDYMESDIDQILINADQDDYFVSLHQAVYRYTNAKSAIFTHSPQAMVQAFHLAQKGRDRIIPVDAEGGYLYPAIPIMNADDAPKAIVEKASRYKAVALPGLGVLSIGHTIGDTSHHASSLKNICYLKTRLEILEQLGIVDNADQYLFQKGKDW